MIGLIYIPHPDDGPDLLDVGHQELEVHRLLVLVQLLRGHLLEHQTLERIKGQEEMKKNVHTNSSSNRSEKREEGKISNSNRRSFQSKGGGTNLAKPL